ncbi:unnamed protein product [Caenorhabditis sp. 36 PRJEB53466]|nr:unnamed protein product [Caenorhabditis sp. 36 PRJEB53466]
MTMLFAFILLVNAIVSSSILFQCSSSKRPPQQRKSHRSNKSSRSRSRSRKSSRSGQSSKSSKSSKSGKSSAVQQNSSRGRSNKKVRAAILADQQAAQAAVKPKVPADSPSEKSDKISYANVRVSPHEVTFRPIGGLKDVRVRNLTGKRAAFMVKCSDNLLFSINPVYGIIESDGEAKINILRENAEPKHDKLVIITTSQTDKSKTAEQTFAEIYNTNSQNYNISVVPLLGQC